jgi:hypothetical protein
MAVPVSLSGGFSVGTTTRFFANAAFSGVMDPNYDVSADGQRILIPERVGDQERFIHVLQNWSAGFSKVP